MPGLFEGCCDCFLCCGDVPFLWNESIYLFKFICVMLVSWEEVVGKGDEFGCVVSDDVMGVCWEESCHWQC